jgi:septal ring factor EnvC (AmiA/AmiB activator)
MSDQDPFVLTEDEIKQLVIREQTRRRLAAVPREQLADMLTNTDTEIDDVDKEMIKAKADWERVRHEVSDRRKTLVAQRDSINEAFIAGRDSTSVSVPSSGLSLTSQGDTNGTPNPGT